MPYRRLGDTMGHLASKETNLMKGYLIKSAAALVLCVAPAVAWGQTEVPTKKPPVQTEGGTQGQLEGEASSPDGTATGQHPPSGKDSNSSGEGAGADGASDTQTQEEPSAEQQGQPPTNPQGGTQSGQDAEGATTGTQGGSTPDQPAEIQPDTSTTGQDDASGDTQVNITSDQRTEIRQVITETKIEPVPSVDFSVDVGVAVPETVMLHPLPPRIIELVPDYEGYVYFVLADGRIVIVDPDTHEIVLIVT